MSPLTNNPFIVSKFPVLQNAIKNILFRGATITLSFVLYRFFAFLAFKNKDYTSFLMFSEDFIQKFLFALSRKFNRQSVLLASFAGLTFAAGFYDTLLWAVDCPGYITHSKTVNAGVLNKQMVATPSYIIVVSNPERNLNKINVQDIFGANLYSPGLNFTLPGIVDQGIPQSVAPLKPLDPSLLQGVSPRIWLDQLGFAVGLDDTGLSDPGVNTAGMYLAPKPPPPLQSCALSNVPPTNPDTPITSQVWNCTLPNSNALTIFQQPLGHPQYWWDSNTKPGFLQPSREDNLWAGLSTGGDTVLMKQIFTVTKGSKKHTFLQTTFKATMIAYYPAVFADADVTDFLNRLWRDPNQGMSPTVQDLVVAVLQAQKNETSLRFGLFVQQSADVVVSYSTEYLYVVTPGFVDQTYEPFYAAIRFASTVIKLVHSETLLNETVPLAACDGWATNIGTGVARSMICVPFQNPRPWFLGQLDTTSVVIINGILGDGSQGTSAAALNQEGMDWYNAREKQIDNLLTSRGLIISGSSSKVAVEVQTNEVAISYFQLILVFLPVLLALIMWAVTFQKAMDYYQNSFFAAVFATVHGTGTTPDESERRNVGYMRSPPEIVLKKKGGHVSLQMPKGDLVIVSEGKAPYYDMVFEPLILPDSEKEDTWTSAKPESFDNDRSNIQSPTKYGLPGRAR